MEKITEKISYLKGLAEGLKVDESTNEGKIIKGILDVLADLNVYISEVDDDLAETQEEIAAIDEDLSVLEEEFYNDGDYDDDDCDCCGYDDDDDDMFEVKCPHCNEEVYIDGETIEEEDVYCPSCRNKIEFNITDCDCD